MKKAHGLICFNSTNFGTVVKVHLSKGTEAGGFFFAFFEIFVL